MKMDLAFNNLKRLICHKTQQTKPKAAYKNVIYKMSLEIKYLIFMYKKDLAFNNEQWLSWHKTKKNLEVI